MIESAKFAEVQKFLSLTRHFYTGMPVLMSKKTWDSMSPAERTLIREAADEAKAEERKLLQAQEAEAVERLRKPGAAAAAPWTAAAGGRELRAPGGPC